MNRRVRLIARVAIFSALVYVISWGTSFLPNITLAFFIVFASGFLWGLFPGLLVGAIGMWLFSTFNPYGPATLPVTIAQVGGMALSGLGGWGTRRLFGLPEGAGRWLPLMALSAVFATAAYYLPVALVDAWVFQPFWPRFLTSLVWSLWALGSNLLIFTLLFPLLRRIYEREQAQIW